MGKLYNLFKEETNEALSQRNYKLYNELLEQYSQDELWLTEEKKKGKNNT